MAETGKSFWQTAPGVITAVAALVTALGGVLAVVLQHDLIGGAGESGGQVAAGAPAAGDTGRAASGEATRDPAEAPPRIPWARATATLVRRDGTSATVKAPTVGLTCTSGTLVFENGQQVSLELVRSIRFDAIYVENTSADGVVTLLDGRELTDPIHTWNCPITGANELGPVTIQLGDIRRIDFHR